MNLAIAFGAGVLSFLSPCVLPLAPAFLVSVAGEGALDGTNRRRVLVHAIAFVLGFSAVFTALWVGIALAGALAGSLVYWLQRAAGLLLVALGMHMAGLITIPFLHKRFDVRLEGDATGMRRSVLIGAAFGIGLTPCIGPYLGAILTLLLGQDLVSGAALLLAYSLGVGLPFLLIAAGLDRARGALRWLNANARVVNAIGGGLVVLMGLLLLSDQFTRLAQMLSFLPFAG